MLCRRRAGGSRRRRGASTTRMHHLPAGRSRARRARAGGLLAVALILAGCSHGGSPAPDASAACRTQPRLRAPDPQRPRYRLAVVWDGRSPLVSGRESVRFVPDRPVARLVFRLWPNGPTQRREGADLRVVGGVRSPAGPLVTSQPDPTTLAVSLGRTLPAGRSVTVRFRWRLRVPVRPRLDRLALDGRELRLGSFFPILAWQPGVGWATDPPTRILAETSTSPSADFAVGIRVPAGVAVLATGGELAPGRWHARAVRDFALAAGPFRLATATARAPAPVRITVGVGPGAAPAPAEVARLAAADLGRLARRFGPYPWPTLAVPVTVDVGQSGIEYPNLIFEGAAGVERTISHELAHQWFYSLVGNDQARDPWLDE